MFALYLSLLTSSVFAASLGELNIHSALGEPLNADIALLSTDAEVLSSLTATIASEEVYVSQGISRNVIHNNITVTLGKSPEGASLLDVRSTLPINTSFLDLIVQLDWASGRLQREFTVILNLPNTKAKVDPLSAKIEVPVIPEELTSIQSTDTNEPENQANPTSSEAVSSDLNANAVEVATDETPKDIADSEISSAVDILQELTTVRGDTLSAIAMGLPTDGVSLEQLLIALYENNKSAFINNNMNQLKVGQIIRVPSPSQLYAHTATQASALVKDHVKQWNHYRNSLGRNVEASSKTLVIENQQKATGKIATANLDAAASTAMPMDVVKLSSGGVKNPTSENSNQAFDEKISALQEETTARKKALLEAQQLSNALEKQIEVMQKLLILKNEVMANVQKNAENASQSKSNIEATFNATQKNNNNKMPTVDTKTPLAPPSFFSKQLLLNDLLSTTYLIYIIIGLFLVLLVAGWVSSRNKQKKHLDSLARRILTPKDLRSNAIFGDTLVGKKQLESASDEDMLTNADNAFNPLHLSEHPPSVDLTFDGLSLDLSQNDDAGTHSKTDNIQTNAKKDAPNASSAFELNLSAISLDLDDVEHGATKERSEAASRGKANPDDMIKKWY